MLGSKDARREQLDPTAAALAWQQERLGALKVALAGVAEVGDAVPRLMTATLRLLQSDAAALALYDRGLGCYRMTAVRGDAAFWRANGVQISWEEAFVPCEAKVLLLPQDKPRDLLAQHLVRVSRCGLLMNLRYGSEPLGLLFALRGTDRPFHASDRLLAGGLADQAALSLATARVHDDIRHAEVARTEVLAVISHELRTPLNTILGFSELLRDSLLDGVMAEDVRRIEAAGRSLLDVVESLVAVAEPMDAGRALASESVPLAVFWKRMGSECHALGRNSAVVLQWGQVPTDVVLESDTVRIGKIMRHLVRNALKFTLEGMVEVAAVVRDRELRIRVVDTGIGMRQRDQAHVFERFWQADGSTTRRYGGLGLGLHLVHRLVSDLGGTIAVQSIEGVGSAFTVVLPGVIAPAA